MAEKRVLIVEDDAIIANFIQVKLEDMGFALAGKARDGKQAIDLARKTRPDIILMDVMLDGEIDGIEAVEEITKSLDIPVIYLTASSDEETISRLMRTEPHGFLIKPFDDRILYSAMHIAVHRHKTKKELSDTKELLKTTIESIEDMVFSLNINGTFTHHHSGNKHRLSLFDPENLLNRNIKDVFPVFVARQLLEALNWVKDFKKSNSVEFSIEENGEQYWFNCKMSLRRDELTNAWGITMVISDITDSKNMYHELVLSQEKLSEAQNIAGLGSCDIFLKEQKLMYNEQFFKILDISDEITINTFSEKKMIEIIHPDDRARYVNTRKRVLAEKMPGFSIDYRIIDRKENTRYIHSVGQVKYNHEGEATRMMVTLLDVTSQKNNEKLRQDVEVAKKTAEMKQSFFARLSHEIRNPVSGITGLLHLLENTDLDDTQKDYIKALKTSSDTLLNLLNDVLDYSKIESGMMKIKPIDFDFYNTIKNLYTFFIPQAMEKNIDFNYTIAEKMPARIIADENKLVQVVSNLLSNAFKFTQNGYINLNVSHTKNNGEGLILKIEIQDTGPGIEPEEQKELFKDFSQLENASSAKIKGSGLGLSICKQLIGLMGGEIGVISKPQNEGSRFWFTLPVVLSGNQEELAEEPLDKEKFSKKLDCSVLLVEDMLVNQKVIKLMLEEMGCNVTIASNGKEALDLYRETAINAFDIFRDIHYDIILMDHFMPVMDGITALQKLKQGYENTPPVIALTADESFIQNEKFAETGFNDCIIKPVKASRLYEVISSYVSTGKKKTNGDKLELYSVEEIEKKPIIHKNTLDLIVKQARDNNFDVSLLFDSFIEDMERIHKESLTAVEMNDYNSLKLIVMSIKGLSGSIGASQVHATAKLMDRYIRNEQEEEAATLLPLLAEKYTIFKNKVKNEVLKPVTENEQDR